MQQNTITDAREFAKRVWITDECKALAEAYPDLAGFWEHCNRSDCMLALLDAAGFENADKVWNFFELIREEEKRTSADDDLEQWRENFHRAIEESTRQLEEQGGPRYARRAQWANAHTWTFYYAREAVQSARTRAGWDAGINVALEGKRSKEEIRAAYDAAAHEAFIQTMKQQADLLREILGNPFNRPSGEDFA